MTHSKIKVNEGFRILGGGLTIDVIVNSIRGSHNEREADLKITTNGKPKTVSLNFQSGKYQVLEGIEIEVVSEHKRSGGVYVPIRWYLDSKYRVNSIRDERKGLIYEGGSDGPRSHTEI